jgi:Skp family chaperone for outer membrane proteins
MRRLRGRAQARAVCLIVGMGLAVSVVPALAQDILPSSAILTLDQDKLFTGSAFGKAALAREEAATRELATENVRIEQALEVEEKDLTTRRATLPAAEFASLAAAFDTKVEEIRTAQDTKSRSIALRRDEDRQRFLQAAVPVLGSLLTEKGAVAILDKNAIILSLSAIDVTEAAIARVDAALGDGSTLPPPTPAPDPAPAP